MKIKNIFALLGLSVAMGVGVVAGASYSSAKEADAATTSVEIAGSWNSWTATAMTLNGDYYTYQREFAVDDEFKVIVNGTEWVGDGAGVGWCSGMGSVSGAGSNFKVLTAGEYLVKAVSTIGDYGDKTYGISFEKVVAPLDPTTVNFYVKVGDADWQSMVYMNSFTYDTDKTGYKFRVGGKTASSGTLVQFKKESEVIHPGASDHPFGNDNNLRWSSSPNELRVRNGCSAAVLDLFVYEDGYDSYLGGYVADEQTYYFSNNKGWEGTPKYYAYYDSDNKLAAWPGTDMTFASVDGYGQSTYSFTVDINRYPNVIFANQAGTSQTDDLEFADFTDDAVYLTGGSSPYGVGFYHYSAPIYSLQIGGASYTLNQNEGTEYVATGVDLTAGLEIAYSYDGVTVSDSVAKPVSNNNVASSKKIIASATGVDVYVDISAKTIWAAGLPVLSNGYHLYVNTTVHALTYDENGGNPQYYSSLISFAANDELRYIHIDNDMAPVIFGNAEIEGGSGAANFAWDNVKECIVASTACNASIYFKQGSPNNVWFESVSPELVAAAGYASGFNTALAAVCEMSGESNKDDVYDAWATQKSNFASLSGSVQVILMTATSSHDVEAIATFIGKYEYIATKYGTYFAGKDANYNFLGKSITPLTRSTSLLPNVSSSSMIAIISVIAFVSISSIAVLVVYKKRKHN